MSTSFSFELDLGPVLAWFQNAGPAQVRRGVEKGLYGSGLAVMAVSQEIVPIGGPPTSPNDPAPGTLKASGTVLLPEWNGDTCVVTLGYGGNAEAYAWRQHEDASFVHKPGQQWKYLEQPLDEDSRNIADRIAVAIQEG